VTARSEEGSSGKRVQNVDQARRSEKRKEDFFGSLRTLFAGKPPSTGAMAFASTVRGSAGIPPALCGLEAHTRKECEREISMIGFRSGRRRHASEGTCRGCRRTTGR
jgi:hypothetical protein